MKHKKLFGCALAVLILLVVGFFGIVLFDDPLPTVPEIVSVEFPKSIPLNVETDGQIEYRDKEGDVVELIFEDLDHTKTSVLDLKPFGSEGREHAILVFSQLAEDPQEAMKRMILVDMEGHRSAPYLLRFTAGEADEFYGRYNAEQVEQLPVEHRKKLHVFFVADSGSDFEKLPSDLSRRILERSVISQLNGLWDQCGLAFEVATSSVVRLEDLRVKDARSLKQMFITKEGEPMIHVRSWEEGISWFDGAAKALDIPKGDIALFLMGYNIWHDKKDEDIDGHAGLRSAIVTWRHVEVLDESTGEILIPTLRSVVTAHELGHVLGLAHPVEETSVPRAKFDKYNLMTDTTDTGSDLIPEQCRIVRSRL